MTSLGTEVFLRTDGADERLHRGIVRTVDGDVWTVALDVQGLRPQAGQRVLVHHERNGEFMRQAAIVVAAEDASVRLRPQGAAVSAERRRVRRVSYLQVLRQVVKEPLGVGH